MQNCNSCNCGKQSIPSAQTYPVNCEFVIPAQYPYVRPVTDSYTCSCCGNIEPTMKDYPSSGIFKGNGFSLNDAYPYLIDTTYMSYGQALTFSENIYTKITKRDDPSCINLAARFDLTDSTLTNTVRFDFLRNYTARKYEELSGVLPIIKNGIKFRIHYTIYNIDGGIEYEGHTDSKVDDTHFHFTSIKDVFVQSAQGLIIDNIPAMTFQGRYTICITHVEAFVEIINTKEHLQDPSLNPFYTFTDNNRKIQLHNTEISGQEADNVLLIADCQINKSFEYLANISTRLRLNFIAFTSIPIVCGDTSPIWFALNEPTEQSITQLRNEVSALEDDVAAIHQKDTQQDGRLTQIEGQVELNRTNISNIVQRVNQLEQDNIDMNSRFEALVERVEKLESIPLALVSYVKDKEITRSQITWNGYGNLYQAARTFIASGDFDEDVAMGNLVIVSHDKSTINAYKVIEFDKDYLFDSTYGMLDYAYAKDFFMTHTFDDMGGCTSVRKGNFFGRNFDWYYNNFAYSRVRIERSKTAKYWSICNCGNIAELTNDAVKSGKYSEAYKILPFHCLDGINEKHVLCSMNVVPIGDYGLTTGTTPTSDKRDTICVVMIARYILDNFASATEAVTYLKEHVSVYAPLKKDGTRQEIHVMVCDQTKSYLIEFINNEMVVSDMDTVFNGRDYMTNFYNYQTSVDENNHIDYSTVTPYGNGLERYDTITDNINNVNNKDDMFALMKKVWYTHTYDFDTYGWKTELASREYDLKITDPASKYIPYFNIGKEQFEHRTREDGKTWQTVFTSVYDIDKCRMYLMTQENDSEISSMEYENYYTKDEIDNMDSEIEIDPYILTQSSGVTIDFDTNTVTHHGLDFDDCKPFQRKRCNVTDDGVIVAYYGDDAYTESGALLKDVTVDDIEYPIGTSVQTMVYQPKTYYKVEPLKVSKIENGSGYHIKKARYFVSDQQLPGFKLHPAFINADGDEVDYILISAFEGSAYDVSESTYIMDDSQTVDFTSNDGDKLSSIGSSAKPISGTTQQLTRPNAEILANNRGEGWYLYNIKTASLNQLLVLIEYGNSQTGVGRGIVDITSRTLETNCSSYTGSTVGNGSGNAASTINEINGSEVSYSEDGKVSVNYRGMENPWGNMYEHVEGLTIFEGVPYVCNDFEYVETKHDGNYVSAGITMPNEVGYVKYFGYGTYECDWLFIPSAIGGSSDDVIGDYTIINPTTASHRVPILGGSWEDADSAGIYMCNVFNLTGYFACNVTARLVYYPSK